MKKKYSILRFSIYLFTITFFCAIWFIYYFNQKLGPALIECAEDEVNHLTVLVMNNCIRKYVNKTNNLNLLKIEKNNRQEIERIQYDMKVLNQTRTEITTMLETDLDNMVNGNFDALDLNLNKLSNEYYEKTNDGLLFTVSIGSITGNSFFANLGPKIPLNLLTNEDVIVTIDTNITEYGMNNAMIEVNIKLKATTIIQMPFMSKEVTVTNTIPLTMEIIQGTIPNYYLSNGVTTEE